MTDRLFEAPGKWNLHTCTNRDCGLYWLDPMPVDEDLPIAYEGYYTHADPTENGPSPENRHWRTPLGRLYHLVMDLTSTTEARNAAANLFLEDTRPGRLLDVGCGDGNQLLRLKSKGWEAEGQEVDADAGAHALAAMGFTVHTGPLEDLGLPGGRYDAIVMNHVIEHVSDPTGLLRECHRLLAPGGQIIAVTPNSRSLGHGTFGPDWRPLEPPRHLFLFSGRNLPVLARRAGFLRAEVWTSAANAEGIGIASWNLRQRTAHRPEDKPSGVTKLVGIGFQIAASLVHALSPGSGEEAILRAWK